MSNEEILTDFNKLYKAFLTSKNRRTYTKSSMQYSLNAVSNLRKLQKELQNKTYKVSGYTEFEVTVPKKRKIKACHFKDKIVQHVLCDNILCKELKNICIRQNYAGQVGKGTSAALNDLKDNLQRYASRYGQSGYIYRGDISKYYYNISHQEAKDIMMYHYPEDVHWLIKEFIDSTEGTKEIALGNQINTVVSNLYLDGFDKFITGELGIEYYGRYADDFYLIHPSKEYLKYCEYCIKEFLATLQLTLNPKSQLIPVKNGISFLGFHLYIREEGVKIKKDNGKARAYRRKFNRLCKKVREGSMEYEKLCKSYESWKEHASFCTETKIFNYYERKLKELRK